MTAINITALPGFSEKQFFFAPPSLESLDMKLRNNKRSWAKLVQIVAPVIIQANQQHSARLHSQIESVELTTVNRAVLKRFLLLFSLDRSSENGERKAKPSASEVKIVLLYWVAQY